MTAGGGGGGSSPAADYVAGAIAGTANITAGFPMDTGEGWRRCTPGCDLYPLMCQGRRLAHPQPRCVGAVKVRMQSRLAYYPGPWSCFTKILRNEGVSRWWPPPQPPRALPCCLCSWAASLTPPTHQVDTVSPRNWLALPQVGALYRGLSPQLVGGALETGVNYAVYQRMLSLLGSGDLGLHPAAAVPLSAATAGVALSFVLSPAELVKCRLQLGHTDPRLAFTGPAQCLRVRRACQRGLCGGLGGDLRLALAEGRWLARPLFVARWPGRQLTEAVG